MVFGIVRESVLSNANDGIRKNQFTSTYAPEKNSYNFSILTCKDKYSTRQGNGDFGGIFGEISQNIPRLLFPFFLLFFFFFLFLADM